MEQILYNIHFTNSLWIFLAPMLLIVLDVLSGLVNSWKNGDFKSAIMRAGLSKKFAELIYIVVGVIIKYAIGTSLILDFIVIYVCLMELSSLAENCDKLGFRMPEWLKKKLNNVSDEINKEDK